MLFPPPHQHQTLSHAAQGFLCPGEPAELMPLSCFLSCGAEIQSVAMTMGNHIHCCGAPEFCRYQEPAMYIMKCLKYTCNFCVLRKEQNKYRIIQWMVMFILSSIQWPSEICMSIVPVSRGGTFRHESKRNKKKFFLMKFWWGITGLKQRENTWNYNTN